MTRTHRLFQLMQTLRRMSPPITAQSLAYEMAVSLRTIYRDIDELRGLGAVIDG
jgi:predicted DNA-binding transcriptional regulator YafY